MFYIVSNIFSSLASLVIVSVYCCTPGFPLIDFCQTARSPRFTDRHTFSATKQ